MLEELRKWGVKLKEGYQLAHNFHYEHSEALPKEVKKIVFVGMGGSGIAGRIAKTILEKKLEIPLFVADGFDLPLFVDSQTFVIVSSYSGDTWETVSILSKLIEKFIPTLLLTTGGKAAEIVEEKNIPFILLPQSLQPRFALGHMLGIILTLLDLMELYPDGKKNVEIMEKDAAIYIPKFEEASFFDDFLKFLDKDEKLHIWGVSGDSDSSAYRAQSQFNENSKIRAVTFYFPELAHNLLASFEGRTEQDKILFFQSEFLPSRVELAIDSICEILKEKGVSLYKVPILGDNWVSQLLSMILWGDYASYYLAKKRGIDPIPVKLIEEYKERFSRKKLK